MNRTADTGRQVQLDSFLTTKRGSSVFELPLVLPMAYMKSDDVKISYVIYSC